MLAVLTGCPEPTPVEQRTTETTTGDDIKTYSYVKDTRTNLCFMSYKAGSRWGFVTNVPCTKEVEDLIKK